MDRSTPKPQTVAAAKQRLRATSTAQPDYLALIKNHPVASIGTAVGAGLLLRSLIKKGGISPGLLSLGMLLLKKL